MIERFDAKMLCISSPQKYSLSLLQNYMLELGIECSITKNICTCEGLSKEKPSLRPEFGCEIKVFSYFPVENDLVKENICILFFLIKKFMKNQGVEIVCAYVKDGDFGGCITGHPLWDQASVQR